MLYSILAFGLFMGKGGGGFDGYYSLAVTACANGLNVEDYFFRLLTSDEPVMPWKE